MIIPKFDLCPFLTQDSSTIQLRNGKRYFIIDILVQDTHENNRHRGEGKIVEKDISILEKIRAVKTVVKLVPE